jgi:hypothetical protein
MEGKEPGEPGSGTDISHNLCRVRQFACCVCTGSNVVIPVPWCHLRGGEGIVILYFVIIVLITEVFLLTTVSTDLGTVWYGTRDVCLLVTTLVLDQPHAQCVTTPAPGCDALQQAIPRVRSNASRVSRPNSVHVSLFRCAQNPDWSCWWPQAVL